MLQTIHDKAKGWIAYAIVIFISIPFALWGINSYFDGGSKRIVAVVNGEDIPSQTVQNQLLELKQRMPQFANAGDAFLKGLALDNVINQTLLRQQAKALGLRASTQEVVDTIAGIDAFQTNGKFDPVLYERLLSAQLRSPAVFEGQVRDDLTQNQLRNAIITSGFVPQVAANQYQALSNQKREAELFILKAERFQDKVELKDEQINAYYDENKAQYLTEEKVKLAYILLDYKVIEAAVKVNDELLQTYYDENADNYIKPAARSASHILISVDHEATDADKQAAEQKAKQIYADIQSGKKTFEEAATKDSDDKAAAEQNGSLGSIVAGDFDEEFEKIVFGLELGKVSEPIKTEVGYEIVRVDAVTEPQQRTFAEVKSSVEADYRRSTADNELLDKKDELQTLAFENSGDLAPAAEALGLTVQESNFMTRNQGEGIGAEAKIRAAAFSEDVRAGRNSELIEISDTQAAVIRQIERESATQKPLADVKDVIVATLTTQEARKLAMQQGQALMKHLQIERAWTSLSALKLGTEADVQKLGAITRAESKVDPAITKRLFAMNKPINNDSVWDDLVLGNGDIAVIKLDAVTDGEVKDDYKITQQFGAGVADREVAAMLQAIRESAEIERFPENL